MKILIIQENGRHAQNRNFRECFSLQRALSERREVDACQVWGPGHETFARSIDFSGFEVIVNLENYDSGWVPDLSLYSKPYKILWCIDAHCRTMAPYLKEFARGDYHIVFQATRDFVDKNSLWFPNCFDSDLIQPMDLTKKCDLGFCGNLGNRKPYLEFLKKNFNFKSDIFVIGRAMVEAINSYRVHFNKNISCDINYRNFETLGCGIPLLTNYNSQYDDLGFENFKNCVFWNSFDDLKAAADFLLENPNQLNAIAGNGFELSKQHTYARRADQLLDHLNGKI